MTDPKAQADAIDPRTSLISRLEAATGPERELDICIWRAKSGFSGRGTKDIRGAHFEAEANGVPAYTGSLDAAMTLVPEALCASVTKQRDGRGAAETWRYATQKYVECHPADRPLVLPSDCGANDHQNIGASTPAIALCIAALKARGSGGMTPKAR